MQRRERWAILGQLLALLDGADAGDLVMSRVAARANLPYDRFIDYLAELREGELVTADDRPLLTEKGRALLKSWRQWEAVLQRFGLD
jgi:predicted transcriptional regulator